MAIRRPRGSKKEEEKPVKRKRGRPRKTVVEREETIRIREAGKRTKRLDKTNKSKDEGGNLNPPFKKGQGKISPLQGKRGPDKRNLFKRIQDRMYEEEEYVILKNVQLCDEKGKPLSNDLVNVRYKTTRAEAAIETYLNQLRKDKRLLIDFLDRDSGKAVETIRMGNTEDPDDPGFNVILK